MKEFKHWRRLKHGKKFVVNWENPDSTEQVNEQQPPDHNNIDWYERDNIGENRIEQNDRIEEIKESHPNFLRPKHNGKSGMTKTETPKDFEKRHDSKGLVSTHMSKAKRDTEV